MKAKCLPVLLTGTEACVLSKGLLNSRIFLRSDCKCRFLKAVNGKYLLTLATSLVFVCQESVIANEEINFC
jgi:hypothetical protein